LGEISPEEFGTFIGENIRLQPVVARQDGHLAKILEFYMGKIRLTGRILLSII